MDFAELTNLGRVIGSAKDQLRGPVVTGADVRHVRLILDEDFRASEIAQLQHSAARIKQKVLRLDVTMADALRVNIRQGAEKLVDVELHLENRHGRLHLVEVTRSAVNSLRNELEHEIEIHLIFLWISHLSVHRNQI
jgi:hypothetical protein